MAPAGQKKPNTRGTNECTSSQLPDTGYLYVNSDIISAIKYEIDIKPSLNICDAAKNIIPTIVRKYQQVNPRLKLIEENSIKIKIMRLFTKYNDVKNRKIKAGPAQNFKEKLHSLFDIISCQCPIYK